MKLKPSEKHIKALFEDHEKAIDTEMLWNKIEQKKKKRRGGLFFWLGSFALLAVVAISFFILIDTDKEAELFTISDKKIEQKIMDAKKSSNPIENDNASMPIATVADNVPKQTSITTIEPPEIINDSKKSKTSSFTNKTRQTLIKSSLELLQSETNRTSAISIPFSHKKLSTAPSASSLPLKAREKISKELILFVFPTLRKNILMLNLPERPNLLLDDKINFPTKELKSFSTKGQFFLYLGGGIAKGDKNLIAVSRDNDAFANAKNLAENIHLAWNSAIQVGYEKSNISYTLGLQYLEVQESFRYRESSLIPFDSIGITSIIVDENGLEIGQQTGLINAARLTQYDFLKANQYRYLQIPLGISKIWNSKKWSWNLGVEFVPMLPISRKGEALILDELNSGFVDLNDTYFDEAYNPGLQFMLGASGSIQYKLSENFGLELRPFTRKSITSLWKEDSILEEKPLHYGINFGIRYRL